MKPMEKDELQLSGQQKVQQICDQIRRETLEPALKESQDIVEKAKAQAQQILKEAEEKSKNMLSLCEENIAKQKEVAQGAIEQACSQTLEALKQQIEMQLFNPALDSLFKEQLPDSELIGSLIEAVLSSIKKTGLDSDLSVVLGKDLPVDKIAKFLGNSALSSLKEKELVLGNFQSGIKVVWHNKHVTIDLSDQALKELVAYYVRDEFRSLLFKN